MKHLIMVEVDHPARTRSTKDMADDVAFTLGLGGGTAGGYIGEPEEHALYGATSVAVFPVSWAVEEQ